MPKAAKSKPTSNATAQSPQKRVRVAAVGRFQVKKGENSHTVKRDAKSGQFIAVSSHDWVGPVIARIQAMTKIEKIQTLKDAGILTKSGNLAKPYRD